MNKYERMAWKQTIYMKIIRLLERLRIIRKDPVIEMLKIREKCDKAYESGYEFHKELTAIEIKKLLKKLGIKEKR